jgi:hypothetical protein
MSAKQQYASSASVRRALNAVDMAGIQVGSVTLHADGAIQIYAAATKDLAPANDFDRLEAVGAL